ncbi:MAG: calcium-translocating P-type ATPase, PMCA-type [Spirochaetales bacterium]|nr:MAG: calcium-translocating P-type ATPase, PMCA-type [Spirochaetales bacterium]
MENITFGLTSEEAAKRLMEYGPNRLTAKKQKTLVRRFFEQLNNALIYILLAAAVISGLAGEVSDAVIIVAVVLVNALVGVLQESKAEKSLEALQKMSAPKTLVRRDGIPLEIPSEDVVPGDLVLLEAGRVIPCDLTITEAANLMVEESALTGESVPVEKSAGIDDASVVENVSPADQPGMCFMGTIVTYGRGEGTALRTGMETEIGRIAKMLEQEQELATPLQSKLSRFGRTLGIAILILCGLMFGVSLLQNWIKTGSLGREILFEFFLISISLAVAAIPEGLPAIVTIVLALGVQRMSRENAIVRKLPAVETLGSVTVICSDKTGTLTQNRMTVVRMYAGGAASDVEDFSTKGEGENLLAACLVLCNDAHYSLDSATGEENETGDPTETALLKAGAQFGLYKEDIEKTNPRVDELPFDSGRKRMTTVHERQGERTAYTKGATDSVLEVCTHIFNGEGIGPLTDELRAEIESAAEKMSGEALRVLAAAYKPLGSGGAQTASLESGMVFLGLTGMMDPPRLEVKDSIARCRESGITTVMITGDHKHTAFAIARELDIAQSLDQSLSGREIDGLTDEELVEKTETVRVFARVSPEHKVRIVKAFKAAGNIVSMTGDGVNDAPSLKAADIGVAMGITGTDVAKGASDMVLTDDNFNSIVTAVEAGRNIYNNIKKAITFLLSCNAGEIIAIFTAIVIGWAPPLRPIHILWVNLITDTLPALALGMEPPDPAVMSARPRDPRESLFAGGTGVHIIGNGIAIGVLTLFAYRLGLRLQDGSLMYARTIAFVVLSLSQLFHAFNMRHFKKSLFTSGLFKNPYLFGALLIGAALQVAVVTIPPLAALFKVFPLTLSDWGLAAAIAVVPVALNELAKIIIRMISPAR